MAGGELRDLAFELRLLFLGLLLPSFALPCKAFGPNTIAEVAEKVSPWVVNVKVSQRSHRARHSRRWRSWKSRSPMSGEGSGIILDEQGRVMSNHHVLRGGNDFQITLFDGRSFSASIVGGDEKTDLAMLKIDDPRFDEALPSSWVAQFGDSDELRVGQWVVAVGSPYSLQRSVTTGIISALGRFIPSGDSRRYNNLIQTDAPINPGNSGGPLLDLQGRVIGINAVLQTRGQGLGFAIPVNLARKIKNDLLVHGRVRRSWFGVSFSPMTFELSRKLELPRPYGMVIERVVKDGPAHRAGLKRADVLLSFDGISMENQSQFVEQVQETPVGESVKVLLMRGKRRMEFDVEIGEKGGHQ